MAKAAILNVLEDTIGRYVVGLDAKSLNVAVWAGKIELQSLQLDVEAVNLELARQAAEAPKFAIPFRVVEGNFAALRVDVPWARITSKPVVLRASGLDVTIEPYDHLSSCHTASSTSNTTSASSKSPFKKKSKIHSNETVTESRQNDERLKSLQLAEESRQRTNAIKNLGEIDQDYNSDTDSNSYSEDMFADAQAQPQTQPQAHDAKPTRAGESAASTGFKARLVRRIIENLQLDIDDIRFNVQGQGCNIGASIDKFSIFTTDQDGRKSFIDRASTSSSGNSSAHSKNVQKSFLYKALQLEGLAIFCDEHSYSSSSNRSSTRSSKQPYKPLDEIHSQSQSQSNKTYILSPLSFSARLRQSDCLQCIDFPKYLLSAELPNVSFRLSRTQLELLHQIGSEIDEKKHVARPLFPEYRPNVPITRDTAKLWWKYAVRSVGRISRRRSWTEFHLAYQKRKRYIPLYKRCMYSEECAWLSPLVIRERAEMDAVEKDKSISTQGIMTWRNMADAQVDLEFKKYEEREESRRNAAAARLVLTPKKKSGLRSLLFGRKEEVEDHSLLDGRISSSGHGGGDLDVDVDVDDPPITLTVEEMRELDSLALESASDEVALSTDSMLCDVSFEMGSFAVDLVTFASAPLVSLEMGTVLSSFKANADGSFSSTFSLSSLNVHDRITQNSIFPVVIRSLESSSSEQDSKFHTFKNAIEFKLARARNGDQHLEAKIVSYEIVACDVLIQEFKKFTNLQERKSYVPVSKSNPVLEYSVSGGADLFYDANDVGTSTMMASTILSDLDELSKNLAPNPHNQIQNQNQAPNVSDKLSSAFADAWKSKLEKETVWSVQLDLHAPILVLPRSCVDPQATTLVIDLGTFRMTYGKQGVTPEVKNWFCQGEKAPHDIKIDHCSLEMEHFSLTVARAGCKDWLQARNADQVTHTSSESVIEPVTLKLNIGLENGGKSRKCMFGVMEQISLSISHAQIVKMVSLLSYWGDVVKSLSADSDSKGGIGIIEEVEEDENQSLTSSDHILGNSKQVDTQNFSMEEDAIDLVHCSVILQEFQAKIVNDKEESVEAHLLSATAALTKYSDGSSSKHLQMGHFWILDRLKGDYPRRQRLVAHSLLPLPASSYAQSGKYNILETFQDQTERKWKSINSLADIKITTTTLHSHSGVFVESPFTVQKNDVQTTTIDAKFNTLQLHWNPYSIRDLLAFQKDLLSLLDEVKSIPVRKRIQRGTIAQSANENPANASMLILKADMNAFEVYLNSAKDDLPLFHMTMSNTNVNLHMYKVEEDENIIANVAVGDLRLEVPKTIKFRSEYCTILGLSPNHSTSLLQLQYGKGAQALESCSLKKIDPKSSEMFMIMNLSPMRFVHAHATVFTLIEYVTEGVLGALAEKVAESAVQAARQLSQAQAAGQKVFFIRAERFDFVLPEAVYSPKHFVLRAGDLDIEFITFPEPGEAKANVSLQEVTMKCNQDESIIGDPIIIDVNLNMAPLSSKSPDEMATIIDVDISRVAFLLTRDHYTQIMRTLDLNIGEANSFLREENDIYIQVGGSSDELDYTGFERLTHGGVEQVIITKRMYMTFKFEAICLELHGADTSDPLISIAAVKSDISMRLHPDTDVTEVQATLLDLVVEDKRAVAFGREFTKLVQQVCHVDSEHDVFSISYSKSKLTNATKLSVTFGSPQIVFIPDAVSDALSFFNTNEAPPVTVEIGVPEESMTGLQDIEDTRFSTGSDLGIKTLDFSMKTEDCKFILIDMGALQGTDDKHDSGNTMETIVLKGKTSASAKSTTDLYSNSPITLDSQLHADNFEIFAAKGNHLRDEVQILHPTKLSLYLSTKTKGDRTHSDIAFVSLLDFDVILSMRQYALLQAIADSVNDCLKSDDDNDEDSASLQDSLTPNETEKINQLVKELDKKDDDSSAIELLLGKESTLGSQSSHGTKKVKERVIKVKTTLPNTNITVVNDLQGVDEALFKITVSSFINNTEVCLPENKSDCLFHSHTYSLIHADYFNAHSIKWEKLLLKPWEVDFKAVRGKKKNTRRMTTTVDMESHPCQIQFSEQFIISLKSASAMWNVFTEANKKAMAIITNEDTEVLDRRSMIARRSLANRAARSLTTTLPYSVSNRSGLAIVFLTDDRTESVDNFETVNFHFPLAEGDGVGGYRLYGQDSKERKTITVIVSEQQIVFRHIDDEVGKGKQVHGLGDGIVILTEVKKTGKTTILHISSFMDIHNETCLDFDLSLTINRCTSPMGTSEGHSSFSQYSRSMHREFSSKSFGVDSSMLHEAYSTSASNRIWLLISPANNPQLVGDLELPPFAAFRQMAGGRKPAKTVEVFCKPKDGKTGDNLVICLVCKVTLVDNHPLVELFLRPRLVIRNNLFVGIIATTPMSGTFSKKYKQNKEQGTIAHHLSPFNAIEIFHGGSSVAFAYKCADNPIGGNRTGWNKLGWIDIPIKLNSQLQGSIRSLFPFLNALGKESKFAGGIEFFLSEEKDTLQNERDVQNECASVSKARTISITTSNLGVDHTGDILFESWDMNQQFAASNISERRELQNFTFSSFSSALHKRRITMLPQSDSLLRILHLSIDGSDGFKRSEPFCIDDIAFCEGGVESTPIYLEDSTESGYYAYRKLSSLNQSELHVIPEFVLFNGSNSRVRVTVQRLSDMLIDEGKMAIVKRPGEKSALVISIMFDDRKCASAPIQVDEIGLKVVMIRSCKSGSPVGSLAIQTILGAKDSRFVIKLGDLKHGNIIDEGKGKSLIHRDFLHYRIRWSRLEVTFLDTSIKCDTNNEEMNIQSLIPDSANSYRRVAHFVLDRFTLDYQKLFKIDAKVDATRSQLSAIIHNIYVADCTTSPEKPFISYISDDSNFLDFRVRTRGSGDTGLAKIDLLELKIAHGEKKAQQVLIDTNEAFLWNLLDIASRTNTAISQFTSTDTIVEWVEERQSFEVQAVDITESDDDDMDEDGTYRAPRSDMLLVVKRMYVWPSAFLVSFKRNPQAARYQQVKNVKSAKLVVYFMKKLNFTVDKARLNFAGFSCNNIKGPPDRIIGSVKAFYVGQLKKKLFSLLTATSIDEWRQLAGRDDGKDSYVEGDILRTTGNLAGRSVGFLVKKFGQGIGQGVAAGTAEVGNGIQNVSEAIGVGVIGASVNSLVSGIGEGVGNTVEGVGSGGNKIIKGAGKGVGQIIGGVGGGLQQVALGIGKGVASGDGSMVVNGIGDGVTSIGTGVLKGTESVVTGAAEGVFSVGKGLFSGVASLGKGVGNAIQGKKPPRDRKKPPRR